jgi:hypothetical protein
MRASHLSLVLLLAACPLASFSQGETLHTRFTYKAPCLRCLPELGAFAFGSQSHLTANFRRSRT